MTAPTNAVTVYRNVDSPRGDFGLDRQDGDEEYRALPAARFDALMARVNTAAVAANLMRARAEMAEKTRDEAVLAEREACAKVCEQRAAKHHGTFTEDLGESYELGWRENEAKDCATAIRARAALKGATGGSE